MRRILVPALVVALLLTVTGAAHAATASVSIGNNFFNPQNTTIGTGDTVRWTNSTSTYHNVTGASPLSYFRSPSIRNGATFSHTFPSSGTYPYRCTLHLNMSGSVRVRIGTSATSGTRDTTFTLRVSSAAAPSGYDFVVQKRNPGGSWADWRTVTTATTTFRAGAGSPTGTYSFRARLHRISDNAASSWSPVRNLTVS